MVKKIFYHINSELIGILIQKKKNFEQLLPEKIKKQIK